MPIEYQSSDRKRRIPNRPSRWALWMIMGVVLILVFVVLWWLIGGDDTNQNTNQVTNQTINQNTNQTADQNENVNWTLEMPETEGFTNAPLIELEFEEGALPQ
jgi:hypothetical protein